MSNRVRHRLSLVTVSGDSINFRITAKEIDSFRRRADFEKKIRRKTLIPKELLSSKSLIDFSNKIAMEINLFKSKRAIGN